MSPDAASIVRAQLSEAMKRSYVAAYRILRSADQAREACQEAATRALAAADRYDPAQPFYPWFYRILKNHCLDRVREGRRNVGEPRERPVEAVAESELVDDERGRAVASAIARLPDDLRELIELRHFQDMSYEEMAATLDIPIGTVMSRLYRARARLRELLLREPSFARSGS